MPIQISIQELATIVRAVAGRANGASVGELLEGAALGLPRRTLQRRLDALVTAGRLRPVGAGRGRRYVVVIPAAPDRPARVAEDETPYRSKQDWLSAEAKEIRASITRPLSERLPVSYEASFLSNYDPNRSTYLPPGTRAELAEIGEVGIKDLPAGTYLRHVLDRLLIDLTWNSSRLEGNTYSVLETQRLLAEGEAAEGRRVEETQMILNHKAAIEMLAEEAGQLGFNRYTICNLHALLADNLLSDPAACGLVRSRPVGITGTVYHPLAVPQQIEERFDEILEKAAAIRDPFEQAFFGMVHLPYLQPFEDVNKRVSRLAANLPLMRENLCPLSFVDVPQEDYLHGLIGIYELNRVEYLRDLFVWAYRRSAARYSAVRQSLGEPDPFRLRHRDLIGAFVREAVGRRMDKPAAAAWIAREARSRVPEGERARFVEIVEIELSSLHEGNIARYRLRPHEFADWQRTWGSPRRA